MARGGWIGERGSGSVPVMSQERVRGGRPVGAEAAEGAVWGSSAVFGVFRGVGTRDWAARVSLRGERGCAGEPVSREGACCAGPEGCLDFLSILGQILQNYFQGSFLVLVHIVNVRKVDPSGPAQHVVRAAQSPAPPSPIPPNRRSAPQTAPLALAASALHTHDDHVSHYHSVLHCCVHVTAVSLDTSSAAPGGHH